jgi:predicted RNase H-like HicB family nuclease
MYCMKTFTAYLGWDPRINLYVGFVPGIPGAHTQARSLDELHKNLEEVLGLFLEAYRDACEDLPRFIGSNKSR